jgi:hypothetical protein
MESSTGLGTGIQMDLGYGGFTTDTVGTAARGTRISAVNDTLYTATASTQNASLVFYTSTAGTLTEKIKLGDIANLYIPTVVDLGSTTSTSINANSGDLFDLQANNNLTINNPFWSDTAVDGKMIKIRI